MYFGWLLCTLCLLECRVKGAVGDSLFVVVVVVLLLLGRFPSAT